MIVKFKKLSNTAKIFKYSRDNDACLDMFANESAMLDHGETKVIKTGIALELPHGYEGQVRGRSGLSSKGIITHFGTIDEEYRGEIGITITNLTPGLYYIKQGDKLAQLAIKKVISIELEEVQELTETERGEQGYGSSGR